MASKPSREGDSISTSSVLLPQLRHSRRGSLSSLASTTQLGKESISQALDQIHFTASQSESLTTFNEYTSPPSSSSGPDSKSLAGELQGGLSGLYNRFRASVGNVRDIVNVGGEDEALEKVSAETESSRVLTPASTASLQGKSDTSQLPTTISPSGLGRPIPGSVNEQPGHTAQGDAFNKLLLKDYDDQTSLGAVVHREAPLKPPPLPLKQVANSTVLDPVLARNCSHDVYERKNEGLGDNHRIDDVSAQVDSNLVSLTDRGNRGSKAGQREDRRSKEFEEDNSSLTFPIDGIKDMAPTTKQSTPKTSSIAHSKHLSADDQGLTHDNVFGGSPAHVVDSTTVSADSRSNYQHLEIPLRKSLAPPLISLSDSPRPSLSRASSTDTNVDSLITVPHESSPRQRVARMGQGNRDEVYARSKPTVLRDPRTMNVFSQVKNKVLNKEYWMKDENARDCFCCGDPFSTFRRKHHCSKSLL